MKTAIVIAGPGKSIVRNNEASVGLTRCVDRTQASWEPKLPHSAAGVLYFECTLCALMHSSLLKVQEKALALPDYLSSFKYLTLIALNP